MEKNEKKKPKYDIDAEAEAYAETVATRTEIYDDEIAKAAYKAGAMATLEYAKEAMLQNVASFNRQCLVDFLKDAAKQGLWLSLSLPSDIDIAMVTDLLHKWGLSDKQIQDIGLDIEK